MINKISDYYVKYNMQFLDGENTEVVVLPKELSYLFKDLKRNYIELEDGSGYVAVDKTVFSTFAEETFDNMKKLYKGNLDFDWDVIHVDGNIKNDRFDNLKMVIFSDKKFEKKTVNIDKTFKDKSIIDNYKKRIKELESQNQVLSMKYSNSQSNIDYYKKENASLQKDVRKAEAESNRLWKLLEKNKRRII